MSTQLKKTIDEITAEASTATEEQLLEDIQLALDALKRSSAEHLKSLRNLRFLTGVAEMCADGEPEYVTTERELQKARRIHNEEVIDNDVARSVWREFGEQ